LLPHLHKFFFQFPEQNMYWNIAPLRSAWIFLFNESSFAQKLIPQRCNLSRRISERATSNILAISPVRVFKFIDLGCVRTGISWSFWIWTFSYLYVSVHVKNLMKTAGLALELWRCWRIWFLLWSRIHGNALSCLQNNTSAQSTPKVTVGSRNNRQQTKNIP
jgi:hypothetical protein